MYWKLCVVDKNTFRDNCKLEQAREGQSNSWAQACAATSERCCSTPAEMSEFGSKDSRTFCGRHLGALGWFCRVLNLCCIFFCVNCFFLLLVNLENSFSGGTQQFCCCSWLYQVWGRTAAMSGCCGEDLNFVIVSTKKENSGLGALKAPFNISYWKCHFSCLWRVLEQNNKHVRPNSEMMDWTTSWMNFGREVLNLPGNNSAVIPQILVCCRPKREKRLLCTSKE